MKRAIAAIKGTIQVVLLVVKAGTQSIICNYFTYISNSFHGDENRGTNVSPNDLERSQCAVEGHARRKKRHNFVYSKISVRPRDNKLFFCIYLLFY